MGKAERLLHTRKGEGEGLKTSEMPEIRGSVLDGLVHTTNIPPLAKLRYVFYKEASEKDREREGADRTETRTKLGKRTANYTGSFDGNSEERNRARASLLASFCFWPELLHTGT